MTFGKMCWTVVTVPSRRRSVGGTSRERLDPAERERHATVATAVLDDVDVVVAEREEGLPVRRLDVVALEEAFEEHLPVDVDHVLVRAEQLQLRAEHFGEPRQRRRVDLARALVDEHDTVPLRRRHRHEAVGLDIQPREAVLVGDVAQRAVQPVDPPVEGTDERPGATLPGHEGRAAMAAGVAERVDDTVVAADSEDGRASGDPRHVATTCRQGRRGAERHRLTAQDELDLSRQPVGRPVVGNGLAPRGVAEVRRPAIEMLEDPVDQCPVGEEARRTFSEQRFHVTSLTSLVHDDQVL